jgi:hypothetical protein
VADRPGQRRVHPDIWMPLPSYGGDRARAAPPSVIPDIRGCPLVLGPGHVRPLGGARPGQGPVHPGYLGWSAAGGAAPTQTGAQGASILARPPARHRQTSEFRACCALALTRVRVAPGLPGRSSSGRFVHRDARDE